MSEANANRPSNRESGGDGFGGAAPVQVSEEAYNR